MSATLRPSNPLEAAPDDGLGGNEAFPVARPTSKLFTPDQLWLLEQCTRRRTVD